MRFHAYMLPGMLLAAFSVMHAQEGPVNQAPPKIAPDEIVRKFAAKEKEFKLAREQYTYHQSVLVQTVESDGKIDGQYQEEFDIVFDDKGELKEKVTYAPLSTLVRISMSPEDLDDIRKRLPFVLTSDEIPDYNIRYIGTQRVDELDTYVFDIVPKKIDKGKRYFQGRLWVDTTDLQIVKTYGKTVPDLRKGKGQENLFPSFTTYREQIDDKYWFPTYTIADDTLHFSSGAVHIREIVTYTNYKRFESRIKIIYDDQDITGDKAGEAPPKK
ncbi:MAG: hypothetical protein Q7S09_03785 [bacterium]|nr:hypothetical protein [bacterium]